MSTTRRKYARRLPPEQRREQLLDAALSLIPAGFDTVTMESVAKRAEVTKPVLYDLFANRGELISALLQREASRATEQVLAALPTDFATRSPDDAFADAVRGGRHGRPGDGCEHEETAGGLAIDHAAILSAEEVTGALCGERRRDGERCHQGAPAQVGDLHPGLQAKLLQVLQDGEFSRLGGKHDVQVDVRGAVTQRSVLDALEAAYPMLAGTIRDHDTQARRPFLRFFACEQDLSHEPSDAPLPDAVVKGDEPFMIVGAIAGG